MYRLFILTQLAACSSIVDGTSFWEPYVDPEPAPAPPDHGAWLSMDLEPNGQRLVMAYYDREQGGLGFAIGEPNEEDGTVTWAHEQVDGYFDPSSGVDVGDRGKFASMKVAPDGTVWIAYYDVTKRDLRYAHRKGGIGSWVTGLVDNGEGGLPSAGEWCSLALDASGSPVIVYQEGTSKALKIARLGTQDEGTPEYEWATSQAWAGQAFSETITNEDGTTTVVSREANVGQYARLMIDGATEYIAYYDAAQQRLGLLEGGAGNYTQSFVTEPGTNQGQWPSMMIDGGTLWIAFHDVTNQNLVVGSRAVGGWAFDVADPGEYVGADTEIFKRGGDIAVAYFDGQNNDMKLASRSGDSWNIQTLGSDGAVGFFNEVVRRGDTFWTASYNYTSRSLITATVQ